MAITIEEVGTAFDQHCVKHSKKISSVLLGGLEFEKDLPRVKCDHSYQGKDLAHSSVVQPYQKAFTPNNNENISGELNFLEIGKVDLSYDINELQKFWTRWECSFFEAGKDPKDWTFPKMMMNGIIQDNIIDELNELSYNGDQADPVPGTAGALLTTFTGYKPKIEQAITDGKLVPLATGALTDTTMVEQVRDMVKQLPKHYKRMPGVIEMSDSNALRYAEDYQAKYPGRDATVKTPDREYLRVDHLKKIIIPRKSMEGSDRMIIRFPGKDSMITGFRDGYNPMPTFRVYTEKRELHVLAEFYRFFGFESFIHMFVNDQV